MRLRLFGTIAKRALRAIARRFTYPRVTARDVHLGRAPSGKPQLVVGGECGWGEFPARARAVVRLFGMKPVEKVDGPDLRMWITRVGGEEFCISWDDWFFALTVMSWRETPPAAVERLLCEIQPLNQ